MSLNFSRSFDSLIEFYNKMDSQTEDVLGSREDPLPLPEELKSSNYPSLLLVGMLILLPFYPIISVIMLGVYVYTRKYMANNPKGQAKDKFYAAKDALKSGETDRALVEMNHLLENVKVIDLYPVLGELYLSRNELETAVNLFQVYLDNHSSDLRVRFLYAITLKKSENLQEAESILHDILDKIDQNHSGRIKIISELGDILLKKDCPEKAVEILETSQDKKVEDLDQEERKYFYYVLGLSYKMTGQTELALTYLRKVYEEDSQYREVKFHLKQN